ncbi:cation channel sperm-associated auxiliary subunit gamma isoform X2 [Nematostella vectensis]|uniref:cation channel sperm-associated auxiliary subunit gamma isoform X2 n=1 Tax=Nematostella vectensis TaxID=45351 RepID=UPI0020776348|nr:cation channel sperm-associated auxiliary subunit gamma isoform X2 [Nematostella vectensis]
MFSQGGSWPPVQGTGKIHTATPLRRHLLTWDNIRTVVAMDTAPGTQNQHLFPSDTCLCGNVHPSCSDADGTSSSCCPPLTCEPDMMCNPAWLVPLPSPSGALSMLVEQIETGVGIHIQTQRQVLKFDGFHAMNGSSVVNAIGLESLPELPAEIPMQAIGAIPNLAPVAVLGGIGETDLLLYSSSEFAKIAVLQFQGFLPSSPVCSQYSSPRIVKGALSLLDRIVINTPTGLIEVIGDFSGIPDHPGASRMALPRCIRQIKCPSEAAAQFPSILAIGERPHHQKIYLGYLWPDKPLMMTELLDVNSKDVCQFVRELSHQQDSECNVVSGSTVPGMNGTVVLLVALSGQKTMSNHLLRYTETESSREWELLYNFPPNIETHHDDNSLEWLPSHSHATQPIEIAGPLVISEVQYPAVVRDTIFVTGNALLVSQDGGRRFQRLTSFPCDSNITAFTSSLTDGTYSFFTDTNQLWVGMVGSSRVVRLEPNPDLWPVRPLTLPGDSANWTVLALFYDSTSRLQQIVLSGSCVARVSIPVEDLTEFLIYQKHRLDHLDSNRLRRNYDKTCPGTHVSAIHPPSQPVNVVPRQCPFARVEIKAPGGPRNTRSLNYQLAPPLLLDKRLIYTQEENMAYHADLEGSFKSSPVDTETIAKSHSSTLPSEISLGRGDAYTFEIFLYLDNDQSNDNSAHSWTVEQLQISLHLSNASLINITSSRTELNTYNAVRFEVTLQERRLVLPQYPPGEMLLPTVLHVQAWNSAFACTRHKRDSEMEFRGSYITTVYLGCPANRVVRFDGKASRQSTDKDHFCAGDECFLYEIAFQPVFQLLDVSTNRVFPYLGHYTLKVIGGGLEHDSIRDYTNAEVERYNFRTSGSAADLVWAAQEKTLAVVPVFNQTTNGIRWLCGSGSPCGNVRPKFMGNAEFYFKLEFSNRGIELDSTNCDYTLRFVIRIHGLPPGSINPSCIIVGSCFGIMVVVILVLFAFKRKDHQLWRVLQYLANRMWDACRGAACGTQGGLDDMEMRDVEGEAVTLTDTTDKYNAAVGIAWEKTSLRSRRTADPVEAHA